jgi:SET domain
VREDIHFFEAPKCGVGQSKIDMNGHGLFALYSFEEGEIVANYYDSSKSWEVVNFKDIPQDYKDASWWVGVDKSTALLGAKESIFMRANHSKDPNTHWDIEKKTLTAKRKISPGEEITYDYRLEIAPDEVKSSPPSWA